MSNSNGKNGDETTTAGGGRPGTLKKEWAKPFLDGLAEHANVAHACRLAEISQSLVYHDRKVDEEFTTAWKEALDEGISKLEIEARRRALHGVPEDEGLKYSDTLTIFLLKAHRPEVYRDNINMNVTHKGGVELRFAGMTRKEAKTEIVDRLQGLLEH